MKMMALKIKFGNTERALWQQDEFKVTTSPCLLIKGNSKEKCC